MRVNRQQQTTMGLMVLAVLLGSLWAGGLVASAAGNPADQLAASHSLLGVGPAVLPDRAPALRSAGERPELGGRLVPVLLGMLATAFAVAYGVGAGRLRSGLARARSLVQFTPLEARAPPSLQPA
jgi:hypothetical protein